MRMLFGLKNPVKLLIVLAALALILLPLAMSFSPKQGKTVIALNLKLPKGYEFTEGAPFKLQWTTDKPVVIQFEQPAAKDFKPSEASSYNYKIPLRTKPGSATVTLKAELYYCDKVSRMCFHDTAQTSVPLEIRADTPTVFPYVWNITPKQTRSGFISPPNFNNGMSLRGAQQGDAAISLYKNEIASPAARNDITARGVRDTYETASKDHRP